jgi:hypothetical protein
MPINTLCVKNLELLSVEGSVSPNFLPLCFNEFWIKANNNSCVTVVHK